MADSREVYSWPESTFYLWTASTSALVAFAESIELTVAEPHRKFLYPTTGVGFAARSEYVQTDKDVRLNVGTIYAGQSLFNMSGVNISATITLSGADTTSIFTLWSARRTNFQLLGRENGLYKQTVSFIAPDISGI